MPHTPPEFPWGGGGRSAAAPSQGSVSAGADVVAVQSQANAAGGLR